MFHTHAANTVLNIMVVIGVVRNKATVYIASLHRQGPQVEHILNVLAAAVGSFIFKDEDPPWEVFAVLFRDG
jgi:hypothetical protein